MQPFRARHVQISLVDRRHLDQRRKLGENPVHLFRTLAIARGMTVDEDGLRAEFRCGAQRHGRMNAKLARLIGRGRHHPALIGLSADHDRLAGEGRIKQLLDRNKEGVHIHVENGAVGAHGGDWILPTPGLME